MNWNFIIIFDILTDVYDIFILKQNEGDSFNLICRQYVPNKWCNNVLQAIFQQHEILGSKVGHDRTIDL